MNDDGHEASGMDGLIPPGAGPRRRPAFVLSRRMRGSVSGSVLCMPEEKAVAQTVKRRTRSLSSDDAGELAELLRLNRSFLAPWEPVRPESFFTIAGQRELLERALEARAAGTMIAWGITDETGALVGRINLNGITRGALQSGSLGFWVGQEHNGTGLATRAVAEARQCAFNELGLHRLQAETLVENHASQRVLARNGFTRYGTAPKYLKIAGRWQDHVMYQVLCTDGSQETDDG